MTLLKKELCMTLLSGVFFIATSNTALAANSSVQIQYLQDSNNYEDTFLDLNLAISDSTSLLLSAGNTSSSGTNPVDLDYRSLGLSHQFNKNLDVQFKFDTVSQGNEIKTDTWKTTVTWSTDNWSFGITPEFRDLTLLNTVTSRKVSLDSTGIGASVYYYGIKNWEYGVSFSAYDYSVNTRALSLPFVIRLISSNALTVTSGLLDNSTSASATYFFDKSDLGATYIRNKSAIDGTYSDIFSVKWVLYNFKPFTIGLEAGNVSSPNNVGSSYSGLTLGYRW